MDLTSEGAPGPLPPTPSPLPAQLLQVTPDNVVELAVLFSDAADLLEAETQTLEHDLRLPEPWLCDPVSGWAWLFFIKYFVDDEHSFAKVVRTAYDQHVTNAKALARAAEQYGKTDELNAAMQDKLNGALQEGRMPR